MKQEKKPSEKRQTQPKSQTDPLTRNPYFHVARAVSNWFMPRG